MRESGLFIAASPSTTGHDGVSFEGIITACGLQGGKKLESELDGVHSAGQSCSGKSEGWAEAKVLILGIERPYGVEFYMSL
jgi:hypothetical protein